MDIVILAHFTFEFTESENGRFSYLASMLAGNNNVEIITSDFYHMSKQNRKIHPDNLPYKVTYIPEPGYPRNICIRRFTSHFIWGNRVLEYLKNRKMPDVVYSAVPSLDGPYCIAKYCEKNGVRFVIDIQDLWPEAFQMVFNVPILSDIAFLPFRLMANGIYKRADAICGVSDTYVRRALRVNKKCAAGTTVYLGTELAKFDKYASESPILKKEDNEIWLAYCGTLGASYDLTCVMDAVKLTNDYRLRFIVMGDGPQMNELKAYAKDLCINAEFVGRLNYDQMCCLLRTCDIAVNPIMHNAAQSIINKHADYAASGLPVLSTQESMEYQNLVNMYNMGFNCRNNDSADLAEKIRLLIDNEKIRIQMGENARKCAEEQFDRKITYRRLVKIILGKYK